MNQHAIEQSELWLQVSAKVLMEEPARLQQCILAIYKNRPELCCYATDLAQLRMTGPAMETNLLEIWEAKTVDSIERIIGKNNNDHPAGRALSFFADLMKANLTPQQTVH